MEKKQILTEQFYARLLQSYDKNLTHSGVNGERLASRLTQLSQIGQTADNGSKRMGFSKEERQAKSLVKSWFQEAGLNVYEDGAGNVFGRVSGRNEEAPAILSGSHVDSVPNGGHFDGPVGVLTALEVAHAWKETNYTPEKPFEVVIFSDEEGSRFKAGFSGSAAVVGQESLKEMTKLVDVYGQSFDEVMDQAGLSVEGFLNAKRDLSNIHSFIEVHIEQGKILEKENLSVGAVTGIAGPCWLEVVFHGEAGHAGNTPMTDRKDALVAASQFVYSIESIPKQISETAVATVGHLNVEPNGVNVIPKNVTLTVDIRDIHKDTRDEVVNRIKQLGMDVEKEHGLKVELNEKFRITPVPMNDYLREILVDSIEEHQETSFTLPSGAGHDAMILGEHVPISMLFVRSKNGISHNPKEWTELNDIVTATHVLKTYIERLMKDND
ncbi:Zn-dependent hydrolase [Bacillus shivajii]|uniref:Zn-dependent hydrolase n=1 Tax=Bacillus shivajii TaxID=1983719 RepID=UPI001CFB21BF|nr:Zn-dependent hydrolase [Bacillus shivajii]UCZ55174.1 Zn-dependent hydrolase [Bacillus shivajii]